MPLPLAPVASIALRYGTVALAAWLVARNTQRAPTDFRAEEAMDDTDEGLSLRRSSGQVNANARWRRVIRLGGSGGPGLEIDATTLSRVKFRKV